MNKTARVRLGGQPGVCLGDKIVAVVEGDDSLPSVTEFQTASQPTFILARQVQKTSPLPEIASSFTIKSAASWALPLSLTTAAGV